MTRHGSDAVALGQYPSQRAKSFQDALSEAQIHDESTVPYQHESMPVESTSERVDGGGDELSNAEDSLENDDDPFTEGEKEMGLHFAADASPDDAARGITGGVGMLCGGAIITVSARQHLATPDMHANEVLAAGTIMHKIVPLRGLLTEMRIPQEQGTPLYIDSASTVFVAQSRGAVKKSAWIRRRVEVLTETSYF